MSVLRRITAIKLIIVVCLLQTITMTVAAAESTTTSTVVLGYGSLGWSYRQVAYDGERGFEAPSFDDKAWTVGQAGFGTTDGTCPWNNPNQVKTNWDPGTDLLLRHHFTVPDTVAAIHIEGTVDNNADVYVNGNLVQHVDNGFCTPGGIYVDVPASALTDDNVLAIRARDLGSASFIDMEVTYADSPLPEAGSPVCQRSGSGGVTDDWAYTAVMGASDGLEIQNLRFGPRLVARLISVPYIKPVGFGSGNGHLSVTPEAHNNLQSSLLSVHCSADGNFGVEATYLVTSSSPNHLFLVHQAYRFDPFDKDERCEATETAPCVRFWPTVTWALKDEAPSPDIGLEIVQRFEFDPDAVRHGAADVIADTFKGDNLGVNNLSSDGYLKREDIIGPRFDGGPMLNHGPVLDHGRTVYWENWHQTGREQVSLPSPISAGCTECVHAHWSWFRNLSDERLAQANRIVCGISNCWSDGKPQILDGSQQTVYAGWVKWRPDAEQQPADWRDLIDPKDQDPSKVDPTKDRLVFYWDAKTTASGSPSSGVRIDGVHFDVGDSYWPQLDNKRHGGNGSMFLVPARRFTANDATAPCANQVQIAPDYDASKRYYDGALGSPRVPAGYVLPVKLTLERPAVCAYVDPSTPAGYRDQGPYYLRVKSTGPRLLNADPFYSANFGGAPWVRVYPDTLTGGGWNLSKEPRDPQVLKYDYQKGYMLALLVFDRPPSAADTSFELDAAPNGVATYQLATGNW